MSQMKSNITELLQQHFSKESSTTAQRSGNIFYSYDRVSSKDQMVNGNSLVWQFERIDEFASKSNLIIKSKYGGTYESAKNDERKEFQRMLKDIEQDKKVAGILVYSYDRFSRSGANGIFLLENLQKLGVKIVAITQEVDSFTPTGNFQQNLYMLLSKLDNDMRKDKSISGTKSILRKGYWPYATPVGYTNQNKHATADKHIYIINEDGLLIKKAFQWKASGKMTNQQIVEKLNAMKLKITLRHMAWILANPFYCGYIISSLLPGEVNLGKHPPLIDEKTFLMANNIGSQDPRHGVIKMKNQDDLPLKIFMKDVTNKIPFTGYYNKKKKIHYYKTRGVGSKVNVNAKKLNNQFLDILTKFEFERESRAKLQEMLDTKLSKILDTTQVDEKANKKRITELRNQIERLEERFVLNEITAEQFSKFSKKFQDESNTIEQESKQNENLGSNLKKAIEKGLKISENISQMWVLGDFYDKQKLQYLLFPEGMQYDKENDLVRTTRINSLFSEIALLAGDTRETKKGNLLQDCLFGSHVGMTRFELATPRPPDVCPAIGGTTSY
jgi:site-specific DNA recombinase